MIGGGPFLRVARNTIGRDLLCGDVHGHFSKLQRALDAANFDPAAGDRLFLAGDMVDRGPESEKVLDWLAQPWCYAVQGNHEAWAVLYHQGYARADSYCAHGGSWFVGKMPCERGEYAAWFQDLPLAIELETAHGLVGIVHADMPLKRWADLEPALRTLQGLRRDALVSSLQWGADRFKGVLEGPVEGVRAVVVGHTPVQRITSLDNTIFIDTGAWKPRDAGEFVLLDAETLEPARQLRAAA